MMVCSNLRDRADEKGNIFVSNMSNASPPITPQNESSTPADLFPDVHRSFLDGEHRRMAGFIERSAGCIDFRAVQEIRLCSDQHQHKNDVGEGDKKSKQKAKSFELELEHEGMTRFEAHSAEIAKEWVDRLNALMAYWKRRHRVE